MKRIFQFMGVLLLAGSVLMAACSKDDEDPITPNPNPQEKPEEPSEPGEPMLYVDVLTVFTQAVGYGGGLVAAADTGYFVTRYSYIDKFDTTHMADTAVNFSLTAWNSVDEEYIPYFPGMSFNIMYANLTKRTKYLDGFVQYVNNNSEALAIGTASGKDWYYNWQGLVYNDGRDNTFNIKSIDLATFEMEFEFTSVLYNLHDAMVKDGTWDEPDYSKARLALMMTTVHTYYVDANSQEFAR